MAGKVLDVTDFTIPDQLGCDIANYWFTWDNLRADWKAETKEVRQYVFATDTTKTTNSKLPWKNKTTLPKICQIRDNLNANYMASIWPKKKNLRWDADDKSSATQEKVKSVTGYMCYTTGQPSFKDEISKCILDYIDCGNCFAMPIWIDGRVEVKDLMNSTALTQTGYVGPGIQRISPFDIVFNPTAPTFAQAPKIIRSIITLGEIKDVLQAMSTGEDREAYEELYEYLHKFRREALGYGGDLTTKDAFYAVDGFTSYRDYLESNYVELLTFYGDIYDRENNKFLKNQVIMVVDRHKVISQKPNQSFLGTAPIRHVGWRKRQDNLWAMGPLANLVGMQYRLDHIENLKADVFDLITFPPLKIKGYVEDFEWGPFARINLGEDGDVEMMAPPFNVLTANGELQSIMMTMEELSGSPKEAMGIRSPGEKTKYEVQQLENAASRIFQNKIGQFEEYFLEPLLNDMLEMGRRLSTSDILVKYFDDELKMNRFMDLTVDDISGAGRIKPYAARHFAEQAQMVQNLTAFAQSPWFQSLHPHFSGIKTAALFEDLFDLTDYNLVTPYVRLAEDADGQRIAQAQEEAVLMEALTAAGISPDDYDLPPMEAQEQIAPGGPMEQAMIGAEEQYG
jgi:hypothetical protein